MQNTFSQSGNDSKWFLKKSFFKIGMWHSRPPRDPPPFMANAILNFHFDFLTPSLSGSLHNKIPTKIQPWQKLNILGWLNTVWGDWRDQTVDCVPPLFPSVCGAGGPWGPMIETQRLKSLNAIFEKYHRRWRFLIMYFRLESYWTLAWDDDGNN